MTSCFSNRVFLIVFFKNRFTILYHRDPDTDLARIVGFEVEPASVRHQYDRWDDASPRLKTCAGNADEPHPLGESPQLVSAGEEIGAFLLFI